MGLAAHRCGSRPGERGGTFASLLSPLDRDLQDGPSVLIAASPGPCPFVKWTRALEDVVDLSLLSAVRINGDGQEILYLAEGDNVRLGCPYILDPEDYGPNGLDIEWMQVNSDPSHRENVFLSYQDKRINHGNLPHLQQRVRFAASDPSQYDASINLMNLQVSDTATYECRVKKTTMASRKVIVTVQARPAVPLCWSEGHMTHGNDVVLKCFANGGTPPLSYKWAKISGHTHPYRAGSYHSQHSFHSELSYQESFHSSLNQVSGLNNGDLVLKDISREDDGLYQCTVANHVGYSVCVVEVKVSDSRRIGMIIGAVLGSLLMLGCLFVGIWGLVCCCCGGAGSGGSRSGFVFSTGGGVGGGACGDLASEIREDAEAPGCKVGGRGRSVTHLLGYPTQTVSRSLRRKYSHEVVHYPIVQMKKQRLEEVAILTKATKATTDPSGEYGTFAAQSGWVAKYLLQPCSSSAAEGPCREVLASISEAWSLPAICPGTPDSPSTSQPDPEGT
ncbi:V-set and immunoglobulin domain-containing protein 8 [Suricata suricatta]|uniref:V-set and immunoglobulin domain-containing protein 8 n=1 Tax=Suricata suricatta TaxID=37032 RepID=UPI001155F970|nr:V-set and immunoglobulin domain-containing protein 8 [Suricata suricatta]